MNKTIFILCLVSISTLVLSGCVNEGTTTEKTFENIIIDSDVVELSKANMEFEQEEMYTDNGESFFKINSVEVQYLFHNLKDDRINLRFFVEFYNKDDERLHTIGPRSINLIADYTEQAFTDVNKARYNGERVEEVEYVKIIAFEV